MTRVSYQGSVSEDFYLSLSSTEAATTTEPATTTKEGKWFNRFEIKELHDQGPSNELVSCVI